MTGMPGGGGDQRALRRVVIDDQQLQGRRSPSGAPG
jgi:hypothetical protein